MQQEWEAWSDPNKKLKLECATIQNTKYCNLTVTGDNHGSLTGTYHMKNEKDSPSLEKSFYKLEGTDYEHPISAYIPKCLADLVVKFLGYFW